MNGFRNMSGLFNNLINLTVKSLISGSLKLSRFSAVPNSINGKCLHTTSQRFGLMEFFDDEKNWGKEEIKCGRSWKKDELRLKSNVDLHKLWYVLLKEKNMLLTVEEECKEKFYLFPNPERIDKVEESMTNLEDVIRERNRAYYLLETGQDGERPGHVSRDQIGRTFFRYSDQHHIPQREHKLPWDEKEVEQFRRLYREKQIGLRDLKKSRRMQYYKLLLKRYEKVDIAYLKELHPEINFKEVVEAPEARGHRVPSLMK